MRRLLIGTVTPYAWDYSQRSVAKGAVSFSEIEADSGWQAMQLLYQTDKPKIKAELFEIALEEACHSEMLRRLIPKIDSSVAAKWHYKSRRSLKNDDVFIDAVLADIAVSEGVIIM